MTSSERRGASGQDLTTPSLPENRVISETSEALWRALSPLGRRVAFPPDIPFQAAEARGAAFNATIGQITDGRGHPVPVPEIAAALAGMEAGDFDRALLYSPVEGVREVREAWRAWQRRDQPEERSSSLPLVTVGLTHGLAIAADLFAAPGRPVVAPTPYWGNYRQTFANRTGAVMREAPAWVEGRFHSEFVERALEGVAPGEPAVAIVNLPSNPGGYSPTREERARLVASLARAAEARPLVVVCDDAYAGLVYEPDIPAESLFWDIQGLHSNLIPVKVDGGTKEFSFFGGRVGFVTFACAPGSELEAALVSKVKCLVRATVGSPVATSQMVLLRQLRSEPAAALERVRELLAGRYRTLRAALGSLDRELIRPLPFNSGCFALLELAAATGATANQVRRHLLDRHQTGLVSIGERYLRIAFCSVEEAALGELVERLGRGVAELAGGG